MEKKMEPFLSVKYPSLRTAAFRTPRTWIKGKKEDDGAEGLWRVHDGLYDLTDFVAIHPGGRFWLDTTKGTDITEAFESYHITQKPEELIKTFFVRKAKMPRNYRFTFKEDGFYRTLKRRIQKKWPQVDRTPEKYSKLIMDLLFILTLCSAILTARLNSYWPAMITAILLDYAVIVSHNFFHKRDNWRMKLFNITLMDYEDWRISHAISHHLYPNTLWDLEISSFEPFFMYLPSAAMKNFSQRFVSWLYFPVIISVIYLNGFWTRIQQYIFSSRKEIVLEDILISCLVPGLMMAFAPSIGAGLGLWTFTFFFGSFYFGVVTLLAQHHDSELFHEGDELRKDLDWGLFQLDTVVDCHEYNANLFVVLTHFGGHLLHHLFPAIDHALFPQLDDVFLEVLREFEESIGRKRWYQLAIGHHLQLARIRANQAKK